MNLVPHFLRQRGNYGGEGWVIPHNEGGVLRPHDIEYARNMAGHTMDYALGRGDFAPIPKRSKLENVEQMEADSSGNQIDPPSGGEARGDGAGTAGGHRGSLIGNTQTNIGYEKHYQERQYCYSKKLKIRKLNWGLSIYGPKDRDSGQRFRLDKWGTTGTAGKAIPGMVVYSTDWVANSNPFEIYTDKNPQLDLSESIYSCALNFKLKDFLDNKLLSDNNKKGIFTEFNKFKLKSFTIQIIPTSRNQSVLQSASHILQYGRNNNGWQEFLSETEKNEFLKKPTSFQHNVNPGYFIFRDQYTTYSDVNNNIPLVPPDALATASGESDFKREQYAIKNLDRNLTFVKDGETFSFTREINSVGSYYFDRQSLINNLNTNIANIVNVLEGQVTDGSSIINKMMEGFNLLIVPGKCSIYPYGQIKMTNAINGYLLLPELTTELEIKTLAKWEAFDYNYSENNIQGYKDPLDQALFNFNIAKSVELAQLNRS